MCDFVKNVLDEYKLKAIAFEFKQDEKDFYGYCLLNCSKLKNMVLHMYFEYYLEYNNLFWIYTT